MPAIAALPAQPLSGARAGGACTAQCRSVAASAVDVVGLGRQLATLRAQEHALPEPDRLLSDPVAQAFSVQADTRSYTAWQQARGAAAQRYVDDSLLNGTALHHKSRGDFNQVVLLPDAFDTRPFRLPWLPGTVIFMLASAEAHALSKELLADSGIEAHVPRGCLLRRVNADPARGDTFEDPLLMAGFRGDRASIWALEGGVLGGNAELLETTLAHAAFCAAYNSLVVGSVPGIPQRDVEIAVADVGLLGSVYDAASLVPESRESAPEDAAQHVVFSSQHMRLSLAEMETYSDHVRAYEEGDEDVNDEFRRL